jgi:hypothetical protein
MGEWYPVDSTAAGPGAWVPPPEPGHFKYHFPPRVKLGDSTFYFGFELIIPANSPQTPHRYRLWRRGGDTLVIVLSDGTGGVQARLLQRGRDWVGAVRTASDNIGTLLYERTITLRSVDCDSPPPAAADVSPHYTRRRLPAGSSGWRIALIDPRYGR